MSDEPRYIFGDILTGKIIEEIPCQGVSMSLGLGGGEFRASFGLDLTGKDNIDLVNATIPGKTYVVCEAGDGSVVYWGGILWSATYQSQAKIYQVFAKTMDQYATKRIIQVDRTWENTDLRQIFLDLYVMMQADPNSVQVELPTETYSGLEVEAFSVTASDQGTYRTSMDNIANTTNGFEWTVDWQRTANGYSRKLRLGKPLGQAPSDYDLVFEYPGAILNYWRNDTIGGGATNIIGVGAGEGSDMSTIEVVHADLLNNGFPRYDEVYSYKDITDIDQLETLTLKQAEIHKAPQPVYTVEMKADREPTFGSWGIGDACRLVIDDPRHPNVMDLETRVVAWEYYPKQSDQVSEVRLTFEGDDSA